MILVFGGTTEGKKTAALLDFLSEPYLYSTKTKSSLKIKGKNIFGAKDFDEISKLCIEEKVNLIINAAHPFAKELHRNIFKTSEDLNISIIRFERIYPDLTPYENIKTFSSFKEMTDKLLLSKYRNVLCLTGVQTIPHYAKLINERNCYFRILNTKQNQQLAKQYNVKKENLILIEPKEGAEELINLIRKTNAEIILSKESGESGFFMDKVEASNKLSIPLWVVGRLELPSFPNKVNSIKTLLQTYYTLRKRFRKAEEQLRHGYTTGSCVAAAAKACFIALVKNRFPEQVSITIPTGDIARFLIFSKELTESKASCVVIKDAGDDPDVTHGKEIGCELRFIKETGVHFVKGKGIGTVTLPGLQVKVGEPAINPVPRKMILSVIEELCNYYEIEQGIEVIPFVPEGEELAKQTFNPRVGVVGGISIIGTSGKVIPYSNEAFLSTIKYQISVAKESNVDEIVLTSGKRSENILKPLNKHLPETSYIHFGNLVGETLKLAIEKGVHTITIGLMLGKAMKLAEGHLDTHSKNNSFNPVFAEELLKVCNYPMEMVKKIQSLKLANAIKEIIQFSSKEPFYREIAERCYNNCKTIVKEKAKLKFILIADKGETITIS